MTHNNTGIDYHQLMHSITSQARAEFERREFYGNLPADLQRETTLNTICRLAMEQVYQLTVRDLLHVHYYLVKNHDHYRHEPAGDKILQVWRHATACAELQLAEWYA